MNDLHGYGGFTIGGYRLALPMGALREVAPLASLSPIPSPAPSLVGGLPLRDFVVPVLDLRRALGAPVVDLDRSTAAVVVLTHRGALLGLLAASITEVFDCETSSELQQDDSADAVAALARACLRHPGSRELTYVLDPDALARLPGVPWLRDPEPKRQTAAPRDVGMAPDANALEAAASRQILLMRCGSIGLAIDALAVHATIAVPAIEPSALAWGDCRGVIPYAGRRIAAIDLSSLCGEGRNAAGDPLAHAVVLRLPEGYVALLVSEVIDVVHAPTDDRCAKPALSLARPELFCGAVPSQALPAHAARRGDVVLDVFLALEARALACEPTVSTLARTNTNSTRDAAPAASPVLRDTRGEDDRRGVRGGRRMISFEVRHELAVPIDDVDEIFSFDPQKLSGKARGALLGTVTHRGAALSLVSTAHVLGCEPRATGFEASVLVVGKRERRVGFVVERLKSIEVAAWEPTLPAPSRITAPLDPRRLTRHLAQISSGGTDRLVPVLDLPSIAQALEATCAEPA